MGLASDSLHPLDTLEGRKAQFRHQCKQMQRNTSPPEQDHNRLPDRNLLSRGGTSSNWCNLSTTLHLVLALAKKKGSKEGGQLVCEHQSTMCRTVCLAAMPHCQPVDGRIQWCDLPQIHRRCLHCDTWIVLMGGMVTSRRHSPDKTPERSIVLLLQ